MNKDHNTLLEIDDKTTEYSIGAWEEKLDILANEGNLIECEYLAERAIEKFPDHQWIMLRAATVSTKINKWNEALYRWKRLQIIAPELPDGLFGEAVSLLFSKNYSVMLLRLREALEKFPNSDKHISDFLNYFGFFLEKKIITDDLLQFLLGEIFNTLLKNEKQAIACVDIAAAQGKWELSYNFSCKIKDLYPSNQLIHSRFLQAISELNYDNEIEGALAATLEYGFDNASVVEKVASRFINTGKIKDADRLLQITAPRFPDHPWIQMLNAIVASRSKNWNIAIERWSLFRNKFSSIPAGWFEGAMAYIELGEFAKADALAEAGLELQQCSTWDYITAINVAIIIGNNTLAARRWLDGLTKIDRPSHERQAYYNIGGDVLIKIMDNIIESQISHALLLKLLSQPDENESNFIPAILRQTLPLYFHAPASFERFKKFVDSMRHLDVSEDCKINLQRVVFAYQIDQDQYLNLKISENLALNSSLQMLSCLFDGWIMPRNVDYLSSILPKLVDQINLNSPSLFNLAAFAATNNNKLLVKIWEDASNLNLPANQEDSLAVLSSAGQRRRSALHATKKNIVRGRDLRVALCVSGQLRGFQRARNSWEMLGLSNHQVDTFVHVWENIGRKIPYPPHCERAFRGEFLRHFEDAFREYGPQHMENNYPSLFSWFKKSTLIKNEELQKFYQTDYVVVEDENDDGFRDMPNHVKMYYKAEKAWELAASSGKYYDIVIRARPDKILLHGTSIDLVETYNTTCAERKILADGASFLHFDVRLGMGDQFAVGSAEAMDIFSRAYSITTQKLQQPSFGFPEAVLSHETFATVAFYNGILIEKWTDVNFGPPIDPDRISDEYLLNVLRNDIVCRQETKLDRVLLSAIGII